MSHDHSLCNNAIPLQSVEKYIFEYLQPDEKIVAVVKTRAFMHHQGSLNQFKMMKSSFDLI